VENIIKSDQKLNQGITDIATKTDQASTNYCGMVRASDSASKSIEVAYSAEATSTKSTLGSILDGLKTKKNALVAKIEDLKSQLSRAETDLSDTDSSIRTTQTNLGDWRRSKTSASYDMDYYRRKMAAESA